jgi:Tfp pilus assembly protein PilV
MVRPELVHLPPQYGNNVMTVKLCQSQCKAADFIRAGVEYAGERYYDNSFQNYGVPVTNGCNYSSRISAMLVDANCEFSRQYGLS